MVEGSANSEEIREEVFETFTSKIEESDVDAEVAEKILSKTLADDPPKKFSETIETEFVETNED